MAVTLLDASRMAANDPLKAGIIEQIAMSSNLLNALQFENISGSAIEYTREGVLPTVGARAVNEAYSEDGGQSEKRKVALKIVGGDLDVDKFIVQTMGQDVRVTKVQQKIKALAGYIEKLLIKGDETSNSEEFDGLQAILGGTAGNQVIDNGAAGLSLAKLDEAIDACEGANMILLNKNLIRRLVTASRSTSVGGTVNYETNTFGQRITTYNGIPLIAIDKDNTETAILPFTEASSTTSIYIVNASAGVYTGIENQGIQVRDLGELDTKPVYRTRVEWYLNHAVWHKRGAARLMKITDAAVTV
jgi:hypothetical protein